MSPECATAPSADPMTGNTPKWYRRAWTGIKTLASHFLNSADPACDADIVGFCVLLPVSIYWMHTRPVIQSQWAACFATIWGAVGLKAFARRSRGDQ